MVVQLPLVALYLATPQAPPTVVAPPVVAAASPAIDTPATPMALSPRRHHRLHHTPGDPLEGFNRAMFSVNGVLDHLLFRPVSQVYKAVVPRFLRTAIRHVLSNIGEPIVFLNDVLQLRPGRAVRTLIRFAVNSTLGVGGIIDVAGPEGLPHRANGFGNTLGRYGVRPGPYLYLPLAGPSDLRDVIGSGADGAVLPAVSPTPFGRNYYAIPTTVLSGLDQRIEADADLRALLAGAADPYATLRSVYLQNRAAEVAAVRGHAPAVDDLPSDPGAAPRTGDVFDTTPVDPDAAPASPAALAAGTAFGDLPPDPEAAPATPH